MVACDVVPATGFGVKVAVTPGGRPDALSLMSRLESLARLITIGESTESPSGTVAGSPGAASPKSGGGGGGGGWPGAAGSVGVIATPPIALPPVYVAPRTSNEAIVWAPPGALTLSRVVKEA